uniref:TSA: Wollemia nobilis Ref_Wollemi_Transcript_15014_1447 transcribed RNA sequence n=1 Tax=Wollemia nobilis TaxID=56998 RepID=A0A0C9RSL0_9CONI
MDSGEEIRDDYSHGRLAMMELANMLSVPMALNAVIQLNVADIIWQDGLNHPLSASQISSKIPTKPTSSSCSSSSEYLQRIMRMLASYNVFKETVLTDSNGVSCERLYSLTEVGKTLVKDEMGLSFGSYVLQHHQKALLDAWPMLHTAVLDPSQEPFRQVHGKPAYEFYGDDEDYNELMRTAMASVSVPFMKTLLKCYGGFDGVHTLVDVGGSSGFCLDMIIQKHRNIRGINFDLPHVVGASSYHGVSHVGGDMFESIPSGDAIFMKWILTTWSDEKCIQILRNCYKALPEKGKVIACEPVLPKYTDNSQRTRALLEGDIFVMAIYSSGGRERTEEEFKQLGISAGFCKLNALYLDPFYTLLEFQK